MERDDLIRIAYLREQSQHLHEEARDIERQATRVEDDSENPITLPEGTTMTERYEAMKAKIDPFFTEPALKHYDRA
ncbi:MAG: hypothetical protein ACREGG_04845, partial [Candidatus Saccharimonadales bacterium]